VGLFGTLLKVAGKVAKTGLSVATRGASDKVLSVVKSAGIGGGKQLPNKKLTQSQQALVAKYIPEKATPRLSSVLNGFNPLTPGGPASPGTRKRRRSPAKARTRPKATRSKGTRRAPSGGLDLAKIGVLYRQQGKPMAWRDFVKANSHIRKG